MRYGFVYYIPTAIEHRLIFYILTLLLDIDLPYILDIHLTIWYRPISHILTSVFGTVLRYIT